MAMEKTIAVRALWPGEADRAAALYRALGRDGAWGADEEECPLAELAGGGGVLGAFLPGGALGAVCPVTGPGSALPQARALAAGLRGLPDAPAGPVALPAAFLPGPAGCAALAALARALAAKGLWGALAVKPCLAAPGALAAMLDGGLALRRVRPLCALRPHYLFSPAAPGLDGDRIIIVYTDTLALSRRLEDGLWGVGRRGTGGAMALALAPGPARTGKGEGSREQDRDSGRLCH